MDELTPKAMEMLIEAAVPLGCKRYSRETKRLAVRLVMLDLSSYSRAAREVGATKPAVIRWVDEAEKRLRHAGLVLSEEAA